MRRGGPRCPSRPGRRAGLRHSRVAATALAVQHRASCDPSWPGCSPAARARHPIRRDDHPAAHFARRGRPRARSPYCARCRRCDRPTHARPSARCRSDLRRCSDVPAAARPAGCAAHPRLRETTHRETSHPERRPTGPCLRRSLRNAPRRSVPRRTIQSPTAQDVPADRRSRPSAPSRRSRRFHRGARRPGRCAGPTAHPGRLVPCRRAGRGPVLRCGEGRRPRHRGLDHDQGSHRRDPSSGRRAPPSPARRPCGAELRRPTGERRPAPSDRRSSAGPTATTLRPHLSVRHRTRSPTGHSPTASLLTRSPTTNPTLGSTSPIRLHGSHRSPNPCHRHRCTVTRRSRYRRCDRLPNGRTPGRRSAAPTARDARRVAAGRLRCRGAGNDGEAQPSGQRTVTHPGALPPPAQSPGAKFQAPTADEHRNRETMLAPKPGRGKAHAGRRGLCSRLFRRRPTLPGGDPPSTIGAGRLNFRVREGNGCDSAAMATGNLAQLSRSAGAERRQQYGGQPPGGGAPVSVP